MTDSQEPPPNPLAPAPYRPIACERYSEYEVAILHHEKLHLRWSKDNVIFDQIVIPLDLKTEQHEEFLICRNRGGELHRIRLDRIQRMELA